MITILGHFDLSGGGGGASTAHQFSPLFPAVPKSQAVNSPSLGEGAKINVLPLPATLTPTSCIMAIPLILAIGLPKLQANYPATT